MSAAERSARRRLAPIALAIAAGACGPPARPGTPPRHVLLISIEALRADHCGAFGYPRETTFEWRADEARPLDFDRVAADGVLFARAFAPSPRVETSLASLMGAGSLAQTFAAADFATAEFRAAEDQEALQAAHAWSREQRGAGRRTFVWVHLARPAPPFESGALQDAYSDPSAPSPADRYDAELRATNAQLRGLLELMRAEDGAALADTVVVLVGSNGLVLAEDEDELGEGALHVPLVLRHPRSLTGARILDEVVELRDVGPTLCDWFGLDAPADWTGRSLLPLVDSYDARPFERRAARASDGARTSVRTPRWRLVEPGGALYDVQRDAAMRRDVSDAHADVVARLRREVELP